MGFSRQHAEKALLLNKYHLFLKLTMCVPFRMKTEQAMEWLLEHENDPALNEPVDFRIIEYYRIQALGGSNSGQFLPDPVSLQRLKELGFGEPQVVEALRHTQNDYEKAAAWLFGEQNEEGTDEEDMVDDVLELDVANHPVLASLLRNPAVAAILQTEKGQAGMDLYYSVG
jgi:uncharacterized UBP type Zn finger protein